MKHYIIVKLTPEGKQQSNLIKNIDMLFQKSLNIKGIHSVSVHTSIIELPNRHDLMVCIEMEKESLELFDNSDIHKKWKDLYSQYIETKTIFDCE